MTQTAMDIDARPLPAGWKWVKLGEICQIILGQSPPGSTYRKTPDGLPFFQGKADFGEISPTATTWCVEPNKIADAGDILMSVRAPVGPTNLADVRCCIGRGLAAIRCQSSVDTHFLLSAIKLFESSISSMGSGSTFQAITGQQLRTLQFPLPPLKEQKRIAAILNEQMAAVEKAKKAAEERLEAAKALPAAYLRTVFGGKESEDWPIKSLGDIGDVVAGITLGRKTKTTTLTDIPYLRVANVKDGYLELNDIKEIAATEAEIEKLLLREGDILLTEGGDPDKLGRGTIWAEEIPRCIHQNHIYRVRVDGTKYLPAFLSNQIGSSYGKRYFLAHAKQTTGIATINQTVLKGFPFHIPPLEQQYIIVKELDDKVAGVQLAEESIRQELETIDAMPAALLRKAFSGEL